MCVYIYIYTYCCLVPPTIMFVCDYTSRFGTYAEQGDCRMTFEASPEAFI